MAGKKSTDGGTKPLANGPVVIVQKRVRLLSPVQHNGDAYDAGDELEMADSQADSLLSIGAAEIVEADLPDLPPQ